jgi:hypothetical protein
MRRRVRRLQRVVDRGRRAYERLEAVREFDRPDRNLVLTGIPRSGTSLMSGIISSSPNAYCVNEVFYEPDELREQLARTRRALVTGVPVPNRYARDGSLSSDTRRNGARIRFEVAAGNYGPDSVVGSNVNVPYLNRLPQLTMSGARIVALVRDPVFTIASWNTEAVRYIPEHHVIDGDLHPRYRAADFPSTDRLERQAFIWRHYAELIGTFAGTESLRVLCYEQLSDPTLDLAGAFGLEEIPSSVSLENRNQPERFDANELECVRQVASRAGLPELYAQLAVAAQSPPLLLDE